MAKCHYIGTIGQKRGVWQKGVEDLQSLLGRKGIRIEKVKRKGDRREAAGLAVLINLKNGCSRSSWVGGGGRMGGCDHSGSLNSRFKK